MTSRINPEDVERDIQINTVDLWRLILKNRGNPYGDDYMHLWRDCRELAKKIVEGTAQ